MLGLNQDTVNLIALVAVAHMVPWLAIMAASLLMKQIPHFGFGRNWGSSDSKDVSINGF